MPRERITTDGQFAAEFNWSRDVGYVQLATVAQEPVPALRAALTDAGLELVDAKTGAGAGTAQVESLASLLRGWHVDLRHRGDINQLIKGARAARDQAMGRDE
jgi:hypothetical protein